MTALGCKDQKWFKWLKTQANKKHQQKNLPSIKAVQRQKDRTMP